MEKYLNISIGGFNHIIRYVGHVKPDEIEDGFCSYLEKHGDEDNSNEDIIEDVMNSYDNIEWEEIYAYNIILD